MSAIADAGILLGGAGLFAMGLRTLLRHWAERSDLRRARDLNFHAARLNVVQNRFGTRIGSQLAEEVKAGEEKIAARQERIEIARASAGESRAPELRGIPNSPSRDE